MDDAVVGHIGGILPFYHRFAEIPAVSEEFFPIRRFPNQGFVLPIPDVAALEPGIPFQQLPEFFHPAAAVADLVQIFHQNHRPAVGGACQHLQNPWNCRIHVPPHVRDILSRFARFVLAKAGGVKFLDKAVHGRVIGAGSAFVAQGPGINGGMVFVMGNHPHRPFQILPRPGRIMA